MGGRAVAVPSRESVEFGRHELGAISEVQVLRITNLGTAPLVIDRVSIAGDGREEFRIVSASYAGVVIYPGSGCFIWLRFSPRGEGRRRAELVIESNGAERRLRVGLSGFSPAAELICADDGEAWLRLQELIALPFDIRVTGRALAPTVSELDGSGSDGTSRCFRVEVPVLLTVEAARGAGEEPLVATCRFTLTERICVEPTAPASTRCSVRTTPYSITALQRLQLALPINLGAELDWRLLALQ